LSTTGSSDNDNGDLVDVEWIDKYFEQPSENWNLLSWYKECLRHRCSEAFGAKIFGIKTGLSPVMTIETIDVPEHWTDYVDPTLLSFWRNMDSLQRHCWVIIGNAGIGKTLLALGKMPLPMLRITHLDDLKFLRDAGSQIRSLVFDDCVYKPRGAPGTDREIVLKLTTIAQPVTIDVKYGAVTIPAMLPRCFLANHESDVFTRDDAIRRRATIHVSNIPAVLTGNAVTLRHGENRERLRRLRGVRNDSDSSPVAPAGSPVLPVDSDISPIAPRSNLHINYPSSSDSSDSSSDHSTGVDQELASTGENVPDSQVF
jgi:hypothetical protein